MKIKQLLMILIFLTALVFSSASGESEKKQSVLNLINQNCTQCHDLSRLQDIHKTKQEHSAVVKKMLKKSNTDISEEQAADISKYLEAPYWQQPLIRSKCTKCHPLNSIFEKCGADSFSTGISQEKIELMRKKGADITDEEVTEILKILQW